MTRINIPAADKVLDKYFPVLDYGFVAMKDYMSGDDGIVQAARVSYGAGTKKKSDDVSLINYLIRMDHGTPLEMVDFKFHIGMPIFVMRQLIRHRLSSTNEYSGRYSLMPLMYYSPEQEELRKQSTTNKQGSSDEEIDADNELLKDLMYSRGMLHHNSSNHYKSSLKLGIARELARIDLPLSTYTYFYWKINLRSLFNFLKLRLDSHAQSEIRDYAKVLAGLTKRVAPLAFAAFERYQLNSATFTQEELSVIRGYSMSEYSSYVNFEGYVNNCSDSLSKREKSELIQKWWYSKEELNLDLDLSSAKSSEFYEELIKKHAVET